MPIYEYQCSGCNHHFDVIQKMSDSPVKTCPRCAEDKAIRLVSAAGFQLKGSGWYATDFKTKTKEPSTTETGTTTTTTDDSQAASKTAVEKSSESTTTGSKKTNEVDT